MSEQNASNHSKTNVSVDVVHVFQAAKQSSSLSDPWIL
jgi:hypothetical protein